jgi:hypothetical protein
MTTRAIIVSEIQQVAAEQKKTLAPLEDDLLLLGSGLDSLCFAILVSRLEDVIGVDPFTAATGDKFPRTIGELIALYEHAAA